jgi:type I restriction enzyme S subunit
MMTDWTETTLGEVLDVLKNGLNCKQTKEKIGQKVSRIESIASASFNIDKVGYSELSRLEKEKYILQYGDILFSHINSNIHVGKTALFNCKEEVYHGVNLLLMRPKACLINSYLEHFLKYLFQSGYWLRICKQSVNQASVNQQDINKVKIRFPKSLLGQQHIVAILDEAFTDIAKAKENAEKNLQNAKELFESYLQMTLANNADWDEKTLKEIGITQTGTTPKTSDKKNYGNHIPFIKPADVDISGNGEIRYADDGLSEQGLENGRKMLAGSILMVCIGATIGKVGFVDRDVSCNQQINSLTVNKGFYPKFFYFTLRTKGFFEQVMKSSAQATLPIINKGKWEMLSVRFPKSITEQRLIVTKLDSLLDETKKLEAIYKQKLTDLEELKKSILQKTFNGELVEAHV